MGAIPPAPPVLELVDARVTKINDTTWNIECSFCPPPYRPFAGREPLPSEIAKGSQ